MKAQNRGIFMIFSLVLFLVAVLVIHPVVAARADIDAKANPRSSTRIRSLADLPPGLAPALAKGLQEELPVAYRLSKTGANFQANNPAHLMHFTFTPTGLQMSGTNGDWDWGMALSKWGYAGAVQPVPAAQLAAKGGRLEYRRGPALTEWYLNTAWGLEQGFTLSRRPSAATGQPSLVVLELALSGKVRPNLQDDDRSAGPGQALLLHDAAGRPVARYIGLYAYDSDGKTLPAHLSLSPGGETRGEGMLRISVDDSAARYPITIDPWVQQAKLTASDGADYDYFGNSVAIDGDTVVVGAHRDNWDTGLDQGSAYVFARQGDSWTQKAKLTVSDGKKGDDFGYSVAIDGETVVVLAPGHGLGSAYVFVKPGGGWADTTETAKLSQSDPVGDDWYFGHAAIHGDTVVVGAPYDDDNGINSGSAYVFVKPGGGWANMTQTAKLTASDGEAQDNLGDSVAIDGDTVVLGARDDDIGLKNGQGSAYVFVKPGGGWANMTQTAKLTASDGDTSDHFGNSVDVDGGTVVVGAPDDDDNGINSGSAYVFVKPGGGWADMTQTAKLTASDGAQSDTFGNSVGIDGGTVVVGARWDDIGLNDDQGSAYVFEKPAGGWADMTETAKLTTSDGAEDAEFGHSVAISGITVVVGAPYDDDNGSNSGSAYIFEWSFVKAIIEHLFLLLE